MLIRGTNQQEAQVSHTPHELAEDFPEYVDKIREMKASDMHFAKLADEYHEINRRIHRAETNLEPIEHLAEDQLRKQRGALKDQIYAMLRADMPA
jgi:uncharacterized protein YdcH (DUF465 family)